MKKKTQQILLIILGGGAVIGGTVVAVKLAKKRGGKGKGKSGGGKHSSDPVTHIVGQLTNPKNLENVQGIVSSANAAAQILAMLA